MRPFARATPHWKLNHGAYDRMRQRQNRRLVSRCMHRACAMCMCMYKYAWAVHVHASPHTKYMFMHMCMHVCRACVCVCALKAQHSENPLYVPFVAAIFGQDDVFGMR